MLNRQFSYEGYIRFTSQVILRESLHVCLLLQSFTFFFSIDSCSSYSVLKTTRLKGDTIYAFFYKIASICDLW